VQCHDHADDKAGTALHKHTHTFVLQHTYGLMLTHTTALFYNTITTTTAWACARVCNCTQLYVCVCVSMCVGGLWGLPHVTSEYM